MTKKLIIGVLIVLVVLGGLAAVKFSQFGTMGAARKLMVPPPETIASAVAQAEKWPDTIPAVGSVNASEGVTVAPEIAGTVSEIAFQSGATVKQGDLLVKLDSSSEAAQLRAVEAQVDWAKVSAERLRKLQADKTVSQSELDQAEATLKQATANADNIRAIIDKKTIRAPFAGRLGIRLVNLGERLEAGKGIVSLQSLSPLFVDFSLPQQELARLKTGLKVTAVSDSYPDKVFEGELAVISPELDAITRSIKLRAKFENADERLRAGMFVKVSVVLPEAQPVLAIPSTAILRAPFGDSVFVISGSTNLTVQQKFIRTSRTRGYFVSVESGLRAGDRVVKAGVFKLRNGMSVVENNETTPETSQTPNPPNS
jgi:membrane fusion protein (multidrug efflux system)